MNLIVNILAHFTKLKIIQLNSYFNFLNFFLTHYVPCPDNGIIKKHINIIL